MSAILKRNERATKRFGELCPDFPCLMIPHVQEGWVLACLVDDACHYVHAGQVQIELEALEDVDPHHRGGYIMGTWDGASDTRPPIEVKPGR